MRGALLLRAYMGVTALAAPLIARQARQAHLAQGADPERFSERLGKTEVQRPDGPLVWAHAASLGEVQAIAPLLRALSAARPDLQVLLTTQTQTAATRADPSWLHQFAPLDTPAPALAFLAHWKPDLHILAENELLPRLWRGLQCPSVLIGARSSSTRRQLPSFVATALGTFDGITAQSPEIAEELRRLGVSDKLWGVADLKAAQPAPQIDETQRTAILEAIGARPVWLAANTHPEDDALVFDAAKAQPSGSLLVLAPRHPNRADQLVVLARSKGLSICRRSAGALPEAQTDIYLVDTVGELDLFYSLVDRVFLGGGHGRHGGHAPHEAAAQGLSIAHGTDIANHKAAYAALGPQATIVRTAIDLGGFLAAPTKNFTPMAKTDDLSPEAIAARVLDLLPAT